jgi:hypothetical protein
MDRAHSLRVRPICIYDAQLEEPKCTGSPVGATVKKRRLDPLSLKQPAVPQLDSFALKGRLLRVGERVFRFKR